MYLSNNNIAIEIETSIQDLGIHLDNMWKVDRFHSFCSLICSVHLSSYFGVGGIHLHLTSIGEQYLFSI